MSKCKLCGTEEKVRIVKVSSPKREMKIPLCTGHSSVPIRVGELDVPR